MMLNTKPKAVSMTTLPVCLRRKSSTKGTPPAMFLTGIESSGQIGTIIWWSLHADAPKLSWRRDGKYLACSSMVCSTGRA